MRSVALLLLMGLMVLFFPVSAEAIGPLVALNRCKEGNRNGTALGCLMCLQFNAKAAAQAQAQAQLHQPPSLRGSDSNSAASTTTTTTTSTSTSASAASVVKAAFDTIYEKKTWTAKGGGSGIGSDAYYAQTAIHILRLVLYRTQSISVLDAPCGAVHSSWTRKAIAILKKDIPCFRYHGVDVVSSVIYENINSLLLEPPPPTPTTSSSSNFSSSSSSSASSFASYVQFSSLDLSAKEATLPKGYDVILSRDALQHLSYSDIASALNTYCKASVSSSYLLVGSYIEAEASKNQNIVTGGCFEINLLVEPFSFPPPMETYGESGGIEKSTHNAFAPPKYLLLYKLQEFCSHPNVTSFIRRRIDDKE